MKINWITIIAVTSFVAFFSCKSEKEVDLSFSDFDANDNGKIEKEEFKSTFTKNYYPDKNNKDEEYLDDEDFIQALYRTWNVDGDTILTREEFYKGHDVYYGDNEDVVADYELIDVNDDSVLTFYEFTAYTERTKYFVDWDTDADEKLSKKELAEGVFKYWDKNGDGVISKEEYEGFDEYFMDI